jgi:hypothetical protein
MYVWNININRTIHIIRAVFSLPFPVCFLSAFYALGSVRQDLQEEDAGINAAAGMETAGRSCRN